MPRNWAAAIMTTSGRNPGANKQHLGANKLHLGLIWTINCSDLGHRKWLLFYPWLWDHSVTSLWHLSCGRHITTFCILGISWCWVTSRILLIDRARSAPNLGSTLADCEISYTAVRERTIPWQAPNICCEALRPPFISSNNLKLSRVLRPVRESYL